MQKLPHVTLLKDKPTTVALPAISKIFDTFIKNIYGGSGF